MRTKSGSKKTATVRPSSVKAAEPRPNGAGKARREVARDHPTLHFFHKSEAVVAGEAPIIYVNGRMLPKSQAMVSVFDHGLLYGDGVFEGIRVYKGKVFKCGQHMERLWRSAEALRLSVPISRDEMVQVMRDCITANGLVDGYIRLLVTRGAGTLGLDPRKCPVAGVVCIADQIALYPKELYDKGMKIIVAGRPRTPIECLDPRIKSLNYLNNILAKVEAIDEGCHEAIMLNTDGYVSECTGDNIFVIRDGHVYTPPTEAGILEGITRRFVIDLCAEHGVPCTMRMMRPEEVKSANEVFLTGSAAEIIAVTQIDDIRIGSGAEGPVTRRLREAFRAVVTSDEVPED
ncbi:MAG: branched-chain-amino-acid transaminase [Isosphaera sp.]|nr:branched-chain-amino-acid transaminase [Isosphaera sp.]